MPTSYRKATRSVIAAAMVGLFTPVIAACSGGPGSSGTVPATVAAAGTPSLAHASASVQSVDNVTYTFTTLNNAADPTFNQLLGINNSKVISGYFGSGAAGHPNQGYTLAPPYGQGNYTSENFPGSVQTQVTALNNKHDTAGFWVDGKGRNFGFIQWNGVFQSYKDPHTGTGTVNQILGINDAGIAVGFYTAGNGVNHAFSVNQATSVFKAVLPPGLTNSAATGINDNGDITGFGTAPNGSVVGFLYKSGSYSEFDFPGSTNTQPFGINLTDVIVGAYVDAAGATHGFTLSTPLTHAKWKAVDDPNGIGMTFANGINNAGDIVGFYVDAAGNTDGFLAVP